MMVAHTLDNPTRRFSSLRRRLARPAAIALLSLAPALLAPLARAGTPIPSRPEATDVRLPNGLRVIILPHDRPPGRVVARLIIHAGSLQESDDQRGVAHLIQHLAFQGSTRFPDGSARAVFQSLGMELGKHESAYSSFDRTVYTLNLTSPTEAVMRKGLGFLADVLDGLTFPEGALRSERNVVREELRQGQTAQRRIFEAVLPRLLPGSRLGLRVPTGGGVVEHLTRDECVAFHRAWYGPGNATLILVGDTDPDEAGRLVRDILGRVPPRATPAQPDPGVRPLDGPLAVVETDPELATGALALVHVDRLGPPVRDEAQFRADLIDQLLRRLIDRRLEARSFRGQAAYTNSGAYIGDAFGAVRIAQFVVIGPADRWADQLADLVNEAERARRFGFTHAELSLARDAAIAEARAIARAEPSLTSTQLTDLLTEPVLTGGPLVSAAENLSLVERMAASITADDVSTRYAALFAPASLAVIAELPSGAGAPEERTLLEKTRRLEADPVAAPEEVALLDSLAEPATGAIAPDEAALDTQTGVLTLRFPDGLVAHHKHLEDQAGRLRLRLTIAGGELEETARTRGLTRAAAAALSRPASADRDGLAVRDYLRIRGIEVHARVSIDAVTLSVDAPAEEADAAFALLRLILTNPILEPAALDKWRASALRRARHRATVPRNALDAALADTITAPGEPRTRPLTIDQINRVNLAQAQAWLTRMVRGAPLELAIVGSLDHADAARLTARSLGDLPTRPAPTTDSFARLRHVEPADPPLERTVRLPAGESGAIVAVGFRGADAADERAVRVLDVVERIVKPQLVRRLRDELGLVASVSIANRPARALPGFGVFLVIAATSPDHAADVADRIERSLSAFARSGPGQYDVAIAQTQLAAAATEEEHDPARWARRLADLQYRGRSLGSIAQERDAYATIDPDEVRRAVADRLTPEGRIRVLIVPETPKPPATRSPDG